MKTCADISQYIQRELRKQYPKEKFYVIIGENEHFGFAVTDAQYCAEIEHERYRVLIFNTKRGTQMEFDTHDANSQMPLVWQWIISLMKCSCFYFIQSHSKNGSVDHIRIRLSTSIVENSRSAAALLARRVSAELFRLKIGVFRWRVRFIEQLFVFAGQFVVGSFSIVLIDSGVHFDLQEKVLFASTYSGVRMMIL